MNNKYRTFIVKRRGFILLLMGLVMTFSASAQENGGRGYWTLAFSKTFIEGERSNGENTGIIGGEDGLAEFRILRFVPGSFKADGTYTVENRPDVTVINMGGQKKREERNIYRLSVSWSQPPQYVKITEEGKIALDVQATLNGSPYNPASMAKGFGIVREYYDIEMEVGIMPAVTVGKFTMGFNLMQQLLSSCDGSSHDLLEEAMDEALKSAGIGEEDLEDAMRAAIGDGELDADWHSGLTDVASGKLYNDEDWVCNLKLGEDSYMSVVVTTTFHSRTSFQTTTYSVVQYYLYRYGGDDVDITIRGDDKNQWKQTEKTDSLSEGGEEDEGGESKGTTLPPWVIPVAVGTVGVVGGFTLLRVLRKKDEEVPPTNGGSNGQPTDKPNVPGTTPAQEPEKKGAVPPPPPPPPPTSPTPPPPPTKNGQEGKDGQKDKDPSTYQMILYKEFGDTLMVGDVPKLVGARIEEITVKGEKIDRQDLTAQIEIVEGENITIVEKGRYEMYRAAQIRVEEFPKKAPLEGDVWFIFRAPGGALRNRVVFNIVDGEVRFQQENLTLPARYEKEVRLPFVVVGMNDGTAKIKAIIEDEHDKETKDYSIKTEWSEKDECYYAIIKDQVLDPKQDEGIAGNYLGYTIKIEATKDDDIKKRVIKGELPIYRYYMGLVMRMNGNVNCFHEEYRHGYHDPELKVRKADGKDYAPAQQECYLKLYDYDEETHQLFVIDPNPVSVKWTVKEIAQQGGAQKVMTDILGNEVMQQGLDITLATSGLGSIGTLVSKAHREVYKDYQQEQQRRLEFQKLLNDLGLQFKAHWQKEGEGKIYYVLRCTKGVLIAPNRFDAEMEITAEYDKELYTFKRTVHILSQPRRTFDSIEAAMAAPKQDERIEKGLHEIEGGLMVAGLTRQMAPLLYFIRLQLDFYDVDYGYDARNIKAIQDCYLHALQRRDQEIKEKVAAMDDVDKLEKFSLDWWLEISYEGHDLLENMNWAERIGFAIASFGYSELVFNIPYEMRKCIVEGEGNKTAMDAFKVGAWEAVKAYAIEQAIGGVVGGFKVVGKAVGKGASTAGKGLLKAAQTAGKESLKAGGKVAKEAMKEGVKDLGKTMVSEAGTGLKSWLKKQVSWEVGAAEKAIVSRVKSWFSGAKPSAAGSKFAAAEAYAMQQAVENIENLQTMIEMCRSNPTPQNVLLRNQLILRCQADKQTMLLLKTPRLLGGNPRLQGLSLKTLKHDFNGLLQKIYSETDDLVKADLAANGKVPIDKIQVLNATSSKGDLLKKGLDITFDRDITYFVEVNGKRVYFRQDYVEALYAKHFRKVVNSHTLPPNNTGFNAGQLTSEALEKLETQEAKQAAIAAKLYDQTVIEDVFGHFESYGDDLLRMVDPKLHGEALQNPAKVAEAIFHKGAGRFDYADDLWRQAEALTGWEREFLQARSVSETMEGFRQLKKVFELLKDRDAQRYVFTKIPGKVKEAIHIIENLDGVQVKLSEVEVKLAELGYSFKGLAQEISELTYKIG